MRTLVELCGTLEEVPEERHIFMRLTYQVGVGVGRWCVGGVVQGGCICVVFRSALVGGCSPCAITNPTQTKPTQPAQQDDVPDDYEPPHFGAATEEQANGVFAAQPFSMKVGL